MSLPLLVFNTAHVTNREEVVKWEADKATASAQTAKTAVGGSSTPSLGLNHGVEAFHPPN